MGLLTLLCFLIIFFCIPGAEATGGNERKQPRSPTQLPITDGIDVVMANADEEIADTSKMCRWCGSGLAYVPFASLPDHVKDVKLPAGMHQPKHADQLACVCTTCLARLDFRVGSTRTVRCASNNYGCTGGRSKKAQEWRSLPDLSQMDLRVASRYVEKAASILVLPAFVAERALRPRCKIPPQVCTACIARLRRSEGMVFPPADDEVGSAMATPKRKRSSSNDGVKAAKTPRTESPVRALVFTPPQTPPVNSSSPPHQEKRRSFVHDSDTESEGTAATFFFPDWWPTTAHRIFRKLWAKPNLRRVLVQVVQEYQKEPANPPVPMPKNRRSSPDLHLLLALLGVKNSGSLRGRGIAKAYHKAKFVSVGNRNGKLGKKVCTRGGEEESVYQVTKGYWESISVPNPTHQRIAVRDRSGKFLKEPVKGEMKNVFMQKHFVPYSFPKCYGMYKKWWEDEKKELEWMYKPVSYKVFKKIKPNWISKTPDSSRTRCTYHTYAMLVLNSFWAYCDMTKHHEKCDSCSKVPRTVLELRTNQDPLRLPFRHTHTKYQELPIQNQYSWPD